VRRRINVLFVTVSILSLLLVGAPPANAYSDHECRPNADQTVYKRTHLSLTHDGLNYDVMLCLHEDSAFWSVKFVFNDDNVLGLANEKYLSGPYAGLRVAKWIEISWIRMHDGNLAAPVVRDGMCDQTNDYPEGSSDGGGCNAGNHSPTNNGPCAGWHLITAHPKAFGFFGCEPPATQDFSQTNKVNSIYFSGGFFGTKSGEARFRVKWTDGDVGVWKEISLHWDPL
jgi:hypothetical protein